MGELVYLNNLTKLDIPVERVINDEVAKGLEHAIVIGYDKDGDFYFAGTYAAGPETLWLLELAKKKLLDIADSGDIGH